MNGNVGSFNLIDEDWIPVRERGLVSLRSIFSCPDHTALSGNPLQRIALLKLLLAIAQSACTPADENAWRLIDASTLAQKCLDYLQREHDSFYLFGEQPFLQMPRIADAELRGYGLVMPEIAAGNNTVLTEQQLEKNLSDAEKALLLIVLMGSALGGKSTDNSVVLSKGYTEKKRSNSAGPSLGVLGFLHSFVLGRNIFETLWLNLFTTEQVIETGMYADGLGVAPWEQMPSGEACPIALRLKKTLMGRLVPMSRFCLLTDEGLHYSEGVTHAGYRDGMSDPSVAVDYSDKKAKALWATPSKKPWRELASLLSFLEQTRTGGFDCRQLAIAIPRARELSSRIAIYSAGLRVTSNAGEQYVSGSDDRVESEIWLDTEILGEAWFVKFRAEMEALSGLAKIVYATTNAYSKEQKMDGKGLANKSESLFWQFCERQIENLIDICSESDSASEQYQQLRNTLAQYAEQAFDTFCPRDTARQLDAWAKCRPKTQNYRFITSEAV